MKATLATDLKGVILPTPVMVAAGCLRSPKELHGLADLRKLGGIVTASVTLAPCLGAPTPRVAETPSGVLHAIGLQNQGVEAFVQGELPALLKIGVPVFVSIAGASVEEYADVAGIIGRVEGVSGIELNLACLDEGDFGHRRALLDLGRDAQTPFRVLWKFEMALSPGVTKHPP